MKKVKLLLKRLIISYVIVFIALSSMSSSFARMYDAQCGEIVSQYARDFIQKYCEGGNTRYAHVGFAASDKQHWSSGIFGQGTFIADCTNGVHYMYYKGLGVDIHQYGYDWSDQAISNLTGKYSQYWERINLSDVQPGDVLLKKGHGEMYIGNHQNANFGSGVHGGGSGKIKVGPDSKFTHAFRPKFDVNISGLGELQEENLSIYDENGFIYSGVAKIESYKGSAPFGKWILKKITEILDYIIGMLTLIIRIVFVGWVAIIERLVIDGIVNSVTGITNKRDDSWKKDESKLDSIDKEVMAEEAAEAANIVKPQASGDESNPNEYISEGMQGIADIGDSIQLKTDSRANVTIENIVYNKIPILDINFFNFDSAGGATVDQNGIIYILKENIATWYYVFRTIAIIVMLMVLIYLGIKMAISTAAEKKAVYKEMLVAWIAGFILVFAINYIMYAIIYANETFISWIIPKYENGSEISLYESVRSKAFELKATTGFAGLAMYIILVYYGIRFLIVYFKRYLTITILALISPFIAVFYAINKINKKGKGGGIYDNWMKDFMYTTWLQSIHALIYTLFIQTVLVLTENSLTGIFIAFIFLHFMIKMDSVMRNIFGFTAGKNADKLATVPPLAAQAAAVGEVWKQTKPIRAAYGNVVGKVAEKVTPGVSRLADKVSNKIDTLGNRITEQYESNNVGGATDGKPETISINDEQERKENRKRILNDIATGAKIGTGIIWTGVKSTLILPMVVVEGPIAISLLGSTISTANNVKKMIADARKNGQLPKPTTVPKEKKYKLKGIKSRNTKSEEKLKERLKLLGIKFKMQENPTIREGRRIILGNEADRPITIGPTSGYNKMTLKEINFASFDDFLDSSVTLTTAEGIELLKGMDTKLLSSLSNREKRKLATKLGVRDLHLINDDNNPEEEVEEMLQEEDLEKTIAYMELLEEAKKQEEELEQMYKELTARLDEDVAKMEAIDPEFAKSMQRKKTKELNRIAYVMSEPLSEKDIVKAIQSYQAKVPQFNPKEERISQRDIKGITAELNAILAKQGTDMQMSKEFIKKAEKELTEQHRKDLEKAKTLKAQREARTEVGTDVTHKKDQNSLREKTREIRENDRNNPYSESNANAPKQNNPNSNGAMGRLAEGSSVERLVKNIRNASRGASSKETRTANIRAIEFSRRLEILQKLGEQAMEMTGEELYDINDILRRLESL